MRQKKKRRKLQMIDKMTKYSFILPSGESEGFLQNLQSLGVVDITRSAKPVDEQSSKMLDKTLRIQKAISLLEALDYSQDSDFEAIKTKASSCTIEGCKMETTLKTAARIDEIEAEMASLQKTLKAVEPWGAYDPEAIKELALNGINLHFHCVSTGKYDPEWEKTWAINTINEVGKTKYIVVAVPVNEPYTFPEPEIGMPQMNAAQIAERLEQLHQESIECKATLLCLKENFLEHMRKGLARKGAELDCYLAGVGSSEAVEGHICVFEGFAPDKDVAFVEKALEQEGILYIKDSAVVDDNPPIKLTNNRFVRMFELLTDMYGRPRYDGFDPTPYLAVFFMLFFAMCMGDAGYGIVLVLAGLALKKVASFKEYSPLVMTLGIATVVIGFLFHTFFSIDISQWGFIQNAGIDKFMVPGKIAGYDGTMVVAIVVGIVHLCLAMIVKTIYATKNRSFLGSLSVWGWTLFLVGGAVLAAVTIIFNLDSAVTKWILIGLGGVSALGIFLLNDLHRNPLLNIGAGLWETYNTATGVLGDVLSYLRLYALGLAGSMLGYAFNNLAIMTLGDGGFGWIPFILIALVGHVLNIAMAVLGAFVHPLRLNFLEFYKNSDYDGSGRVYNPLKK